MHVELPITGKALTELWGKHMQALPDIESNKKYVEGKNDYVLEKAPQKAPDNRVPIPWAKTAVEDLSGYAASPGYISESFPRGDGEEPENDEYIDAMAKVYEYNRTKLLNTELYEASLSYGVAYELHYTSTKLDEFTLTPEYTIVDNTQLQLVYSDSLKPELLAAIHWKGSDKANIYYPGYWEQWRRGTGGWVLYREDGVEYTYPYQRVPVAVYPINRRRKPVFEAEKSIIDGHDVLISNSLNEIDRFNALIALFPGKVDKQFVDKLHELKVIQDLAEYDRWPEYLEKSLQNIDEFYNNLADRLERQFHKSIKIPDMSDDSFAGQNTSGVAIAYKILGMEFKAALVDSYFDTGLQTRFDLVNDVMQVNMNVNPDDYTLEVKHQRNIPADRATLVDIALKLYPIVSLETVLRMLPEELIPDVERELSRIEEERQESGDVLGMDNGDI